MQINIPVRTEIEVLPGDEPRQLELHPIVITSKQEVRDVNKHFLLGWSMSEKVGIGIINSRAISKLIIER